MHIRGIKFTYQLIIIRDERVSFKMSHRRVESGLLELSQWRVPRVGVLTYPLHFEMLPDEIIFRISYK
jgi:hypothetical protein